MRGFFEFAGGSVIGRSHRITGKNNQDAYCCLSEQDYSVVVVCDGCGSGEHSEVGAHIGARLIAQAILRQARQLEVPLSSISAQEPASYLLCERVRHDILARLLLLAEDMGEKLSSVVNHYFLFTVVGVLMTPLSAVFFSLGDGVLIINGEEILLGPFPDNAPPYLAYGLVETTLATISPDALRFQIHRSMPTSEVQSFLIGTDGVQDLIRAATRNLPGKSESIGSIGQFWREDRYFANPDMIRRRLAGINRDIVSLDRAATGLHKEAGLLPDDTTLVVGRRKPRGAQ